MDFLNRQISIFLHKHGWVYAPQHAVDAKAQKCFNDGYSEGRLHGVRSGQDIGVLKALRYIKTKSWQDSASYFNFNELDKKYPEGVCPNG